MWGKIFLVTTGLVSFTYFLFPEAFSDLNPQDKDVLGIQSINAQINKSSVDTALTIHCIDRGSLPKNLNDLYEGYLDEKVKIDLNDLFTYKITSSKNCNYQLQPK